MWLDGCRDINLLYINLLLYINKIYIYIHNVYIIYIYIYNYIYIMYMYIYQPPNRHENHVSRLGGSKGTLWQHPVATGMAWRQGWLKHLTWGFQCQTRNKALPVLYWATLETLETSLLLQQCWTFRVCLNFGWNSKSTSGPCSDQAARDFAFCCQRKSIQSILISIYLNTSFRHLTAMAAILKEPLHKCD